MIRYQSTYKYPKLGIVKITNIFKKNIAGKETLWFEMCPIKGKPRKIMVSETKMDSLLEPVYGAGFYSIPTQL